MSEARDRALYRAVHEYGDHLRIEPAQRTVTTLQGHTETGWIVWGRADGGDDLGCVFPNRISAQIAIANATEGGSE